MKSHQIAPPVLKFRGWIRQIRFSVKWSELKISENEGKSEEFRSFERVFINYNSFLQIIIRMWKILCS